VACADHDQGVCCIRVCSRKGAPLLTVLVSKGAIRFGVYPRVSAYRMLDHMAVLRGIADAKESRVTFVTDKAPTHVAVDPYSIWVDRDDKDNVAEVVIN